MVVTFAPTSTPVVLAAIEELRGIEAVSAGMIEAAIHPVHRGQESVGSKGQVHALAAIVGHGRH
jgi:hypothetical protein